MSKRKISSKQSRVWITNHVMARNLARNENGFIIDNPIVDFVGLNKTNVFHTLDHFVCKRGSHSAFIRIVHVDSGIIVQGTEPFAIVAEADWYTYAYTIGWNYTVEQAGVYEYQIWANGEQIAAFRFVQHEG